MDLTAQYARQHAWRGWKEAYAALPSLAGARVLDLGCAIGDQSRDLVGLGAEVVGIDADEALLTRARSRPTPGASFELGDIRDPVIQDAFDGLWASFVPAYFPDLHSVLARWQRLLKPGGWIALTEVAGMFDHQPLPPGTRALLEAYVSESLEVGRYDFNMGGKLGAHLAAAGFMVQTQRILPDQELSFDGAADPEVLDAWRHRVARMRLLTDRAHEAGVPLEEHLLHCFGSSTHTTACRVHFCLARRP